MSDDILAYRLLKSANLFSYYKELVKATIPNMKDQLKKTFSDALRQIPTKSEDIIKTDQEFIAEETSTKQQWTPCIKINKSNKSKVKNPAN